MFIAWFKKQTVSLFHRVTGKPKLFSLHLAGGALARETKVSGDKGFSSELRRVFLIGSLKAKKSWTEVKMFAQIAGAKKWNSWDQQV